MTLSSRPASPEDEPFVRRLIIETLTEQLQAASWPEPMRAHLLEIQYATRRQGVRAGAPAGESRIIVVNGQDAGWTLVSNLEHEIRLLEIMVLGERRRPESARRPSVVRSRRPPAAASRCAFTW